MEKQNICLMGEGGSGKSASIATLFKPAMLEKHPDLNVKFLMSENNSKFGLEFGLKHHGIKLKEGQLQYLVPKVNYLEQKSTKMMADEFKDNYLALGAMEAEKVRVTTGQRSKNTEYLNILQGMATFKGIDYVTKEVVNSGDYLQWKPNTIFVVDSFTTIVSHLVAAVLGPKVLPSLKDYGDVQANLWNKFVVPLTERSSCSIILLGHPKLSDDPKAVQPTDLNAPRIQKLYLSSFGNSLNGVISSRFSEFLYCYKEYGKFYWAGEKQNVDTRTCRVPAKDKLEPDFSLYGLFE